MACAGVSLDTSQKVLVIIRFDKRYTLSMRNMMIKEMSLRNNYRGEVLGYSDQILIDETGFKTNPELTLLLIEFETGVEAHRWLDSSPDPSQQDFLHHADILMTNTKERAERKGFNWINLIEVTIEKRQLPCFDNHYAASLPGRLRQAGGKALVASSNVKTRRGTWDVSNSVFFINQFKSHADCKKWFEQEKSSSFKDQRTEMAKCTAISFELLPLCDKDFYPNKRGSDEKTCRYY